MIIKRYLGETAQEVMQKIKTDLGEEAVILTTRKIRKRGFYGWFTKPLVEIVASVDKMIYSKKQHETDSTTSVNLSNLEKVNNPIKLDSQTAFMEKQFSKVTQSIDLPVSHTRDSIPEAFASLYYNLVNNEVHHDVAKAIILEANHLYSNGSYSEPKNCLDAVIGKYLGNPLPISVLPNKQKIVLFLGPTGVGKTTTLAKLASIFSIQYNMKIALITTDTYRIAAIDQLKTYADILGLPLSVGYSMKELAMAFSQYSDKDIILIDTAGKGLYDHEREYEINEIIQLCDNREIYLVINSNTSYQGCVNIIESYKFLDDYKIIFTKMDDASSYGIILNCCYLSRKPLSYITTGQNVPNDIEIVDIENIKKQLLGRVSV